jgi:hypothetical protein
MLAALFLTLQNVVLLKAKNGYVERELSIKFNVVSRLKWHNFIMVEFIP